MKTTKTINITSCDACGLEICSDAPYLKLHVRATRSDLDKPYGIEGFNAPE